MAEPNTGGMGVDSFLASIRFTETEKWDGQYNLIGKRVNGDRPLGTYQILESQWPAWASRAGIPGANWRDPAAQDRVAGFRAQELFNAFGSWDLVAVAWVGGSASVRTLLQRGYDGPKSIQNPTIRNYVESFRAATRNSPQQGAVQSARVPARQPYRGVSRGWVNPVAGQSKWSGGSWMPNKLTHRGRTHAAIDMYAKTGTPIVAPVSGKILSARKSKIGGYTAQVKGDDGITYYFAHMSQQAVVKAGQKVFAGTHLGYVGNSGSAKNTSPHLHFSMKRSSGEKINPKSFLDGSVSDLGYNIAPMGNVYSENDAANGIGKQMNDMLSQLSDRVAGGSRDSSILLAPAEDEMGAVTQNQTQPQSDLPDFLPGKDQYLNAEVP